MIRRVITSEDISKRSPTIGKRMVNKLLRRCVQTVLSWHISPHTYMKEMQGL